MVNTVLKNMVRIGNQTASFHSAAEIRVFKCFPTFQIQEQLSFSWEPVLLSCCAIPACTVCCSIRLQNLSLFEVFRSNQDIFSHHKPDGFVRNAERLY